MLTRERGAAGLQPALPSWLPERTGSASSSASRSWSACGEGRAGVHGLPSKLEHAASRRHPGRHCRIIRNG